MDITQEFYDKWVIKARGSRAIPTKKMFELFLDCLEPQEQQVVLTQFDEKGEADEP